MVYIFKSEFRMETRKSALHPNGNDFKAVFAPPHRPRYRVICSLRYKAAVGGRTCFREDKCLKKLFFLLFVYQYNLLDLMFNLLDIMLIYVFSTVIPIKSNSHNIHK